MTMQPFFNAFCSAFMVMENYLLTWFCARAEIFALHWEIIFLMFVDVKVEKKKILHPWESGTESKCCKAHGNG